MVSLLFAGAVKSAVSTQTVSFSSNTVYRSEIGGPIVLICQDYEFEYVDLKENIRME